jgi:predicted  nucleic acid-binding Zn-ribbon protein
LEKLNARIVELQGELQNKNDHFEKLQSEKKSLEEERRRLEKAMSDRFAQTDGQVERLTQQSTEFIDVINQTIAVQIS